MRNLKTITMKGFIKVTALSGKKLFININYIVLFSEGSRTATDIIVTDNVNKAEIIVVPCTPEEIADMIDLARY